jgi:hypothetical protein
MSPDSGLAAPLHLGKSRQVVVVVVFNLFGKFEDRTASAAAANSALAVMPFTRAIAFLRPLAKVKTKSITI